MSETVQNIRSSRKLHRLVYNKQLEDKSQQRVRIQQGIFQRLIIPIIVIMPYTKKVKEETYLQSRKKR